MGTSAKRVMDDSWSMTATVTHIFTPEGISANHFAHSNTNLVIMAMPNDIGAAKQTHRTLKSERVTAVTVWDNQPEVDTLEVAHEVMRGRDASVRPIFNHEWYIGDHMKLPTVKARSGMSNVQQIKLGEHTEVKDLTRCSTPSRSFLSAGVDEWQLQDEEMWDQAIARVEREFARLGLWNATGDGVGNIKMLADVLIIESRKEFKDKSK